MKSQTVSNRPIAIEILIGAAWGLVTLFVGVAGVFLVAWLSGLGEGPR